MSTLSVALSETFDDVESLYSAVCDYGLEGVVAKKLASCYQPGEARLDQAEEPELWRCDSEIEGMQRSRERRRAGGPSIRRVVA